MKITFLGTSCMVPTKERNHQSILITHKGEGLLFDCGEGTQRQLKIAGIKPTKITKIFISHWHGDHVFGLPGLLQTMSSSEYDSSLEIYGPKNTKKSIERLLETFSFDIGFPYSIKEIEAKKIFTFDDVVVVGAPLNHSIPTLGYSIKEKDKRKIKVDYIKKIGIPEGPLLGKLQNNKQIVWKGKKVSPKDATYLVKGKKVAIILDTLPCNFAYDLAKDSDLLIAEAVYLSSLIEKAEKYKHLTAKQAAQMASQNNVKKLVLTHFSQRYKTTEELLNEAKTVFENSIASYDLMKIKI